MLSVGNYKWSRKPDLISMAQSGLQRNAGAEDFITFPRNGENEDCCAVSFLKNFFNKVFFIMDSGVVSVIREKMSIDTCVTSLVYKV
ncbi:Hypothetical predicted protein [Scomber scombrus]|uniref:Uncharacterized protein n=1 Tax=Scomber scombrus TaxID=13677 RepID=A0AAV1MWQ9_SCOSC